METRRVVTAAIAVGVVLNVTAGTAALAGHRFSDVPSGAYYHSAVDWLANTGITAGCGDGRFCPEDPVTRGQLAVFLQKAATSQSVTGGAFSEILASAQSTGSVTAATFTATEGFTPSATTHFTVPAGRNLLVEVRGHLDYAQTGGFEDCYLNGTYDYTYAALRLNGAYLPGHYFDQIDRVLTIGAGAHTLEFGLRHGTCGGTTPDAGTKTIEHSRFVVRNLSSG